MSLRHCICAAVTALVIATAAPRAQQQTEFSPGTTSSFMIFLRGSLIGIDAAMITFRDLIAALVAAALFLGALSLATTLTIYRKRRRRTRDDELAQGRRIIAEIPGEDDLRLFTEDERQFRYGAESVDKDRIAAVRVLINGSPIAAYVTRRFAGGSALQPTSFEDRPDGIARDRWDVAIERPDGVLLVECGAIRERVSQELARTVFDAVKRELETRDKEV